MRDLAAIVSLALRRLPVVIFACGETHYNRQGAERFPSRNSASLPAAPSALALFGFLKPRKNFADAALSAKLQRVGLPAAHQWNLSANDAQPVGVWQKQAAILCGRPQIIAKDIDQMILRITNRRLPPELP